MVRIILVRPGATDFDAQGRIQGTLNIPLNEAGTAEAAQLADQLRPVAIEAVYCAPCEPALETGNQIAATAGQKLRRLDQLRNLDHGLWQGMRIDEVRQKFPTAYRQWQDHPERVCPPEGEMLDAARLRVHEAMRKLLKKHREGTLVLVVPEPLASLVRSELVQSELGDLWQAGCKHGCWEAIEVVPEKLVLSGK